MEQVPPVEAVASTHGSALVRDGEWLELIEARVMPELPVCVQLTSPVNPAPDSFTEVPLSEIRAWSWKIGPFTVMLVEVLALTFQLQQVRSVALPAVRPLIWITSPTVNVLLAVR